MRVVRPRNNHTVQRLTSFNDRVTTQKALPGTLAQITTRATIATTTKLAIRQELDATGQCLPQIIIAIASLVGNSGGERDFSETTRANRFLLASEPRWCHKVLRCGTHFQPESGRIRGGERPGAVRNGGDDVTPRLHRRRAKVDHSFVWQACISTAILAAQLPWLRVQRAAYWRGRSRGRQRLHLVVHRG